MTTQIHLVTLSQPNGEVLAQQYSEGPSGKSGTDVRAKRLGRTGTESAVWTGFGRLLNDSYLHYPLDHRVITEDRDLVSTL